MTIKEFAANRKVRIKFDEEGEAIVMARYGQIYDYGSGQFGALFMLKTPRMWNPRRLECEKAGMRLVQDGDTEGCLLFDPENKSQAQTAIRAIGAYRKVQLTDEQRAAKAELLKRNIQASQTPMI